MNKLLKIGIFGGLTLGAAWLFKLKTMSNKLISSLSNPRIHKVDLSGIAFRTEIKLQNPTKNSMTISKPVVTMTSNGSNITSSNPESKSYTIKPLSVTMIDTIELVIPWTSLSGVLTKIPALITAYKSGQTKSFLKTLAIPLEMNYSLYADGLFYESDPQKLM